MSARDAPIQLADYPWQADDPIADKFGYVEGLKLASPETLVKRLIENTSKNGNLLLNISPKADGTIPQDQTDVLLSIGKWLDVNGEAIYATRPWVKYGEGPAADAAAETASTRPSSWNGRTNERQTGGGKIAGGGVPRGGYTPQDFRFTTKGDTLYAIAMTWPGEQAVITSLASGKSPQGKIEKVELLGHDGALHFTQDVDGLKVKMPADKPCDFAYSLKISRSN